jgi:hypothetical protein
MNPNSVSSGMVNDLENLLFKQIVMKKLAGTCEDNNPVADENFVNLIADISAKKHVYTADEES